MRLLRPRRLLPLLAVAAAVLALPAAAPAVTTAKLDVSAKRFVSGAPSLDLAFGATLTEDTGRGNLPVTRQITFSLPKFVLRAKELPTCSANDTQVSRKGFGACPSSTLVGKGTASAIALNVPFSVDVRVYNGVAGKNGSRKLLIIGILGDGVEATLGLRSTLTPTATGWRLVVPIPAIPVLAGQYGAVEAFRVSLGRQIRKGGKRFGYVEVPRGGCPAKAWTFKMRAELRAGGGPLDDQLTRRCPR